MAMASFSGTMKRKPVVGLGDVGTNTFSIFSLNLSLIFSGVLQHTIPSVFNGSRGYVISTIFWKLAVSAKEMVSTTFLMLV